MTCHKTWIHSLLSFFHTWFHSLHEACILNISIICSDFRLNKKGMQTVRLANKISNTKKSKGVKVTLSCASGKYTETHLFCKLHLRYRLFEYQLLWLPILVNMLDLSLNIPMLFQFQLLQLPVEQDHIPSEAYLARKCPHVCVLESRSAIWHFPKGMQ